MKYFWIILAIIGMLCGIWDISIGFVRMSSGGEYAGFLALGLVFFSINLFILYVSSTN